MKEDTIKNYIVNGKLNVEKMIKNFNAYIHTIVENNVGTKLSNEDKEEIISDVFLTVWHNKEKIDSNGPLKYYIAGITKNIISNKLREQKKYNRQVEFEDAEILQDLKDINLVFEERQILRAISEELNNMKELDYKIFSKYYYYSKSIKEIAKELNMSESNVGVKLHRIKKKLRKNLEKRGFTYKKILSVILILFLLTGVVFGKQIVNYVKQIIEKEERVEETKPENPMINMTADSETIKAYMKKYDEKTYLLSINNIKTFEESKEVLGIEFKANYGTEYINKDIFEKRKYDVILMYIEDEKEWNINSVVPYETKVVITMTNHNGAETTNKRQAYCRLIPREDNSENIEIKYSEKEKTGDGAIFYMPCCVRNVQNFENLNLKYNGEGELYYTDFLNSGEYYELVEKLELEVLRDIAEYGKNKEVAIIFKKTNKKIAMKRMKTEGEIQIEVMETDKEYDEDVSISGTVIIVDKGKFNEYIPYMK